MSERAFALFSSGGFIVWGINTFLLVNKLELAYPHPQNTDWVTTNTNI